MVVAGQLYLFRESEHVWSKPGIHKIELVLMRMRCASVED
jgi:hypothetical protein